MSETAINYVCAEAPGIRVAGLLKLKGTFVSPIVAESSCASFAGQVLRYRRKKLKMRQPGKNVDYNEDIVKEYFYVISSSLSLISYVPKVTNVLNVFIVATEDILKAGDI